MLCLIVLPGIGLAGLKTARAQDTLRISAVVNETAISAYDLISRIRLTIVLSGLNKSDETIERLKADTLRVLIDESLKLQEAEQLGIATSEQELIATIARIEQRNKMKPGQLSQLLSTNGVNIDTLLQQIKTNLLWPRTVMAKYGANLTISDSSIDISFAKAEAAREKPLYLLSEIVIAVDNVSNQQQAEGQITRIFADLQNGADFAALARSFSQSPTAAKGGDVGWRRLDQLPTQISAVLATMKPGQISQPIPLKTSFVLLLVNDFKENSRRQPASPILDLAQFHLELPGDAQPETVETYMEAARNHTSDTKQCSTFNEIGTQNGSPMSGSLGKIDQSKLPPHLLKAVSELPVGTPSKPIRTPDGVVVLMVCNRENPAQADEEKIREGIRRKLLNERLTIYERQYIRDIRSRAYIDIRQ